MSDGESGIDREKLFVVSKIWPTSFKTPEVAIEYSMRALNIDYIDMYLLHWPSQNEYARNHAFETLLKYKEKETSCANAHKLNWVWEKKKHPLLSWP